MSKKAQGEGRDQDEQQAAAAATTSPATAGLGPTVVELMPQKPASERAPDTTVGTDSEAEEFRDPDAPTDAPPAEVDAEPLAQGEAFSRSPGHREGRWIRCSSFRRRISVHPNFFTTRPG